MGYMTGLASALSPTFEESVHPLAETLPEELMSMPGPLLFSTVHWAKVPMAESVMTAPSSALFWRLHLHKATLMCSPIAIYFQEFQVAVSNRENWRLNADNSFV